MKEHIVLRALYPACRRSVLVLGTMALVLGGCAGDVSRDTQLARPPGYEVPADPAAAANADQAAPPAQTAMAEDGPAPAPTTTGLPVPPVASTAPALDDAARLRRLASERSGLSPSDSYRVGAGDLIEVSVFGVEEMNRTVRVSQDGRIRLPLLGAIDAGGRTESDLSAEIARRLERDFVHDPQVDVFVEEYRSQQVAVTGAVANPGLYPLTRDRYTLLDVLSEAGGLTEEAGAVIEFIPASRARNAADYQVASASGVLPASSAEGGSAARDAITIDLNDLLRGGSNATINVTVSPGDVVFVPEAGAFTIEGWIDKPGTYELTSKTTVLAALTSGGGPLLPARLGSVQILRNTEGTQSAREVIDVDLNAIRDGETPDVPLRAGDIVRVPGNPVLMVPWGVYSVVANLIRIGASFPLV